MKAYILYYETVLGKFKSVVLAAGLAEAIAKLSTADEIKGRMPVKDVVVGFDVTSTAGTLIFLDIDEYSPIALTFS